MNERRQLRFSLRSIGPAIITASVVLGPGSILAASKIGYQHDYRMVWVLLLAVLMMIGITALSARLGVVLDGTLCQELAQRAGRPYAAVVGVCIFLIAACFQFGNNLGLVAAIEPFYQSSPGESETTDRSKSPTSASGSVQSATEPVLEKTKSRGMWISLGVILATNTLIALALFGFKSLYQPIELLMKLLAGIMLLVFAISLFRARPDWSRVLAGCIPSLPESENSIQLRGKLAAVIALFATTFSLGGAFYQSYLVRQKGWKRDNLKQGLIDSVIGIGVLGIMTLMIMITAAAVLSGRDIGSLNSAADVARQLEPAFGGPAATIIFCIGIFAGALSSFLVNAIIGGSLLADGLGLGGYIDEKWPKRFTVLGLAVGMVVAMFVVIGGQKPVNLVIFAQALTVLGIPALAAALCYLAWQKDLTGERAIPRWMKAVSFAALVIAVGLAIWTSIGLAAKL